MSRRILALAMVAFLSPAAIVARPPDPEIYYEGKLLFEWFQQLSAPSPLLRREAVQVFGRAGQAGKEALPYLREMATKDENSFVRQATAEAIENISASLVTPAQTTGKILVAALNDADPEIALAAASNITKLDKNAWFATDAVAKLKEMAAVKDAKPEVVESLKKTLELIEKSINPEDLLKGLASKDPAIRIAARQKLEVVKSHPVTKKAFLSALADMKLSEEVRETLRGDYQRVYSLDR